MKKAFFCVLLVLASCAFTLGQTYKVLWSFGGAPNDGANPVSNLIFDGTGNLYGTTRFGGAYDGGTVFELSPNSDGTWSETVLYNFCQLTNCADGNYAMAGLVFDDAGNLYGTTRGGGVSTCPSGGGGCGTVFELSPPLLQGGPWTEAVLYNFCTTLSGIICQDGQYPLSQLVFDSSGNLYGTTSSEGTGHYPGSAGGGTVFELSPANGGWTFSTLYNFCSLGSGKKCPDGNSPLAGLTFDSSGNLYGTTELGGGLQVGDGLVYKLTPGANGWTESTVYVSSSQKTGFEFEGAVSISNGTLYTTSFLGGNNETNGGTIIRLNPTEGRFSSLSFNGVNGYQPAAGVIVNAANTALFGTTTSNAFEITAPNSVTVLYNFCSQPSCTDGSYPLGSLVEDQSGNIYGTAKFGGLNDQGVVFEITPP